MQLNNDLKEFLRLLNSNAVDYLIVGAFAVAHHGYPRFTADLDILIRPSPDNAERVQRVLAEFGFAALRIAVEDLTRSEQVLQLGVSPNRIDLLTSISGIDFEDAWASRTDGCLAEIPVQLIGRSALLRNKRSTGRAKDLGDVEELEKR